MSSMYPSVPDGDQVSMEALYSEAYALVDQGICYDEVSDHVNALVMYERCLYLIDQAEKLDNAKSSELFAKMLKAREHINGRLKVLHRETPVVQYAAAKNLVETSSSKQAEKDSKMVSEEDVFVDASDRSPSPFELLSATCDAFGETQNAEQLFEITDGVQIFIIENDEASVPSYPSPLKIFRFTNTTETHPTVFMQVADWVYPLVLVAGRSPTLHSDYGAYLFANPTDEKPDLCIGLILPADLDSSTKSHFDNMLREHTMYKKQGDTISQLSAEEQQRLSSRIAAFLVKSGQSCAWGVEKTAELGQAYMTRTASGYRLKQAPCDQPKNIDKRVQTSVHYLRKGTKVAVKVSGYLVDAIGDAALNLGAKAGKRIEKSLGGDKGSNAGGVFHSTVEVIGGGVSGAATVYMSLEKAAIVLAKGIANETVQTVSVKYGGQAARLTDDALHAAGHTTMTAVNVHDLGPKAIAKRTAKKAGIGMLRDLGSKKEKPQAIEAGPSSSMKAIEDANKMM